MYPYLYIVLPTYAVLAFVGGFAAIVMTFYRTSRYQMDFYDFMKALIFCIIGGVIGSKLLFVMTNIPHLIQNFTFFNLLETIAQSGFVYYGGLFGVLLGIYIYINRNKKYNLTHIYNMIAPAIPLFHGFGRIGCLFAGCCYGIELKQPIVFMNVVRINRVPTQLLEALFEFLLCGGILMLEKKKSSDNLLRIYLITYGIFRFVMEFFRGDEIRGIFFGFSTAQWISVGILTYFVCGYIKSEKGISKANCLGKLYEGGKENV